MTYWAMVLVASLSMPLLMRWTTVTVTVNTLPVPAAEHFWPAGGPWSGLSAEPLQDMLATGQGVPAAVSGSHSPPVNWLALATIVYALVAGLLLLRLAVGLYLTWRLARAAKPMREPWTADWSVRVSGVIAGPVTFGSTILLPPQCFDWDVRKRQAVLAHEGAHVANRDFYLLLLAALNRSVFWFSPFAWWRHTRLAELAEIISDARALEVVEDRLSYAEILLDSCSTFGGRRRASKWQGRVRCVAGWSAFSRLLPPLRSLVGASELEPRPSSCRSSWCPPAPLPTAPCRCRRRRSTAWRMRCASRNRSPSIHWTARRSHRLPGRRRVIRPGQRPAQASLGRCRRWHLFLPAPAGPILVGVDRERQPAAPVLSQNGRGISVIRVAELSSQSVEPDAGALDSCCGSYNLGLGRVLTITREGGRLVAQETGRPKFEIAARGVDAFASGHDDLVVFLRDDQAKVTQALIARTGVWRPGWRRGSRRPERGQSRKTSRVELQRRRINSGSRPRGRAARRRSCAGSTTCNAALPITSG